MKKEKRIPKILTPEEFHRLALDDRLAYLSEAFYRCFVERKPPFIEMRRRPFLTEGSVH